VTDSLVDPIQEVVPLYEQYLEISRVGDLAVIPDRRREFFAPLPAPLTLTISTR